jgi:hypothetical protein
VPGESQRSLFNFMSESISFHVRQSRLRDAESILYVSTEDSQLRCFQYSLSTRRPGDFSTAPTESTRAPNRGHRCTSMLLVGPTPRVSDAVGIGSKNLEAPRFCCCRSRVHSLEP